MENKIYKQSQLLGDLLLAKGWKITTVESCTGGGISSAITEVAGSSGYFDCAYVTYSNEAKHRLVGVNTETLNTYGAVSDETVHEMAMGALNAANANVAIAISGIAGPGGGTELKPVGTVWLAIATRDSTQVEKSTVWSQCFTFSGDRSEIRQKATEVSLIKACELVG
ncbi:CinA family protein [Psychrosphaera sp. 1_MG-2023]|uniref:CinA family protein n=1 Tax=Psychrosphaera sp. 1_MG-2023 TaxID=3062643 RepID=UPI0026E39109|nr:CinA family protein [Psychrosphaera sp. 1_MG-2023]MDO6719131.1 CinA family protein [Psychrosphaera sp. 1_MG-2023]